MYRDVFELEPSKDNFYSTDPEKLQGLKNSILLFGVMQDVLIEDVDGKDRIISGHCRTMCCRMLVEEGHEEFRKINCKYTKVNLNTEKFPEDKDGKVEQLINKLGIIQANRFREKSDWEKMQEALIGFSDASGERLGKTTVTHKAERFCFHLSPEASEYVHEQKAKNEFIEQLVALLSRHDITLEQVTAFFKSWDEACEVEPLEERTSDTQRMV